MDTGDIHLFTAAASAGSLSEAARRLGLQPMAASRRIARLEAELGVRLFQRTTRSLSLTAEGEAFLPYARALHDNAEQGLARLKGGEGASGLLRVSVPVAFGRKVVAPFIPALLERHPELRIALQMSDAMPELVSSGLDLAIRIAQLKDSSMMARKLCDNRRQLVASPAYIARAGMPADVAALEGHAMLPLSGVTHWTLRGSGGEHAVRLQPRFTASSIEGCHAACLAGAGIALLSEWNVADDITAGRLVPITLADAEPETLGIWAVYPTATLVLPKVRVFMEAVREALKA